MEKTVIVTGASSGIGRCTAELMARHGWQVKATSRTPKALSSWAERNNLLVLPVSLVEESSIKRLVKDVVNRFGCIDVLVNNAAYGIFGPLEAIKNAELESYFQTNLFGALRLIRHVTPVMRRQHDGTIVNVSSIGGRTAAPFASFYHAVKFVLEGFSESFRYAASHHGVGLKLIEPAHFKTGFISRSLKLADNAAHENNLATYMQWVHEEDLKAPDPSPVAHTILRTASDASPRLRYPVRGKLILTLVSMVPEALWRSLMAQGMTRRLKVHHGM